jgi:ribosomal protein L37AE/L43A
MTNEKAIHRDDEPETCLRSCEQCNVPTLHYRADNRWVCYACGESFSVHAPVGVTPRAIEPKDADAEAKRPVRYMGGIALQGKY